MRIGPDREVIGYILDLNNPGKPCPEPIVIWGRGREGV
jgi:hypothetical protein